MEGLRRRRGLSGRLAGEGAQGAVRAAGLRLRRLARMAEVFDALGRRDRARALRDEGRATLFKRFNEAFWDDELGFYAYALDGDKQKVLTVASNPGHCLWSRHRPARAGGQGGRSG